MKFENMVIRCDSKSLARTVIKDLVKIGYKDTSIGNWENVICYDFGVCSTYPIYDTALPKFQIKTFKEFMGMSDNNMIKKIHQAKKELGLNNSELSLKMGKSRPYIAKMLNQPQSEKVQNKVIAELDKLLSEPEVDDTFVSNLADELESKDKEISDLKKIIESKDLAISGLIKQNDEAKKIHDKDVKALADKDDQILLLKETNQHAADEVYCFVNKCGQYKSDVASLKTKIKRERIIILIVIVILTALFFLKGSIGG